MAVVFTPNIALAKPTESELAENWVNTSQLVSDNNNIIADQMDVNLIVTAPAIIALTTNPSIGVGQAQLEYQKVRDFIYGTFVIVALDPGVAPGTGVGAYGIRLPELADTSFYTVATGLADTPGVASCIGEGYYTDNSSVASSGTLALDIAHIGGFAYIRPITATYAGKTQRWVGPGLPSTLANADKITGSFAYLAA